MKKTGFLTCVLILIAASPAAAALNEYYTYGGFSPVTIAFQNIALIFADNSYRGVITTFAIFGLFFGCAGGFIKMSMGQGGPLGWLIPFLIGVMLYLGLFVSTTTLAVYDPVYNQNLVVAGLPVGVAYLAGTINHIERYIVDTYDTNAPLAPTTACGQMMTMTYAEFGGAVGLRLMVNSAAQYVSQTTAAATLHDYIVSCVIFEINLPGSTMTLDSVMNPGCGLSTIDVIGGGAASAANYTADYFVGPTATNTCQTVYGELQTYYANPANTNQPGITACGGTGFTDQAACQQQLQDMYTATTGNSITQGAFIGSGMTSSVTAQALQSSGSVSASSYLTLQNQALNGSSGGIMAGIMNPMMMDAYVAYSYMLMPILVLFLVTPLWKNAFCLIVSLICWTALLRSLDVITFHLWAVQYQLASAAALQGGLGISASMQMPTLANQYLGFFASLRNSVFLLATAVAGALFKFGDSAMSRLADKATVGNSSINSAINDKGTAAAMAMEGMQGAARSSMMTAMAGGGVHGWDKQAQGGAANEFLSRASGAGKMEASGGSITTAAANTSTIAQRQQGYAAAEAAHTSQDTAVKSGANAGDAATETVKALGGDAGKVARIQTERNVADSLGFEKGAKKAGVSTREAAEKISEVAVQTNYGDAVGKEKAAKDTGTTVARVAEDKGNRESITTQADNNAFNKREKKEGGAPRMLAALTDVASIDLGKKIAEAKKLKEAMPGKTTEEIGDALGGVAAHNDGMGIKKDKVQGEIAEGNMSDKDKKDPTLFAGAHYTPEGEEKRAALEATHKQERAELLSQSGSGGQPVDTAKTQQALNDNIKSGNFAAIAKDGAQVAGLAAATGRSAQDVKNASPDQQKEIMQQAKTGQQSPEQAQTQAKMAAAIQQSGGQPVMSESAKGEMKALEAKQAGETSKLESDLKKDPASYQKAGMTEAERFAQQANIARANPDAIVNNKEAYGPVKESNIMGVMKLQEGAVSNKGQMYALADKVGATKGYENTANEIRKMANAPGGPRGFGFQMASDKDGHLTGFTAVGGGTATLNDKAAEDRTNRMVSGTSSVVDNTHKTASGTSSVVDNTHKTASGTSSVVDDSHKTASGTSSVVDDSHKTASGTSSVVDDSHKTASGTSSVVDNTHKTASGTSSVVDDSHTTTDGTSHTTNNLTSVQAGDRDVLYAGSSEIHTGTKVDGATSAALGQMGEAVGLDKKTVETFAATALNVASDVLPIANAASGARATDGAAREAAQKAGTDAPGPKATLDRAAGWVKRKLDPVSGTDEAGRPMTRSGEVLDSPSVTTPKGGAPASASAQPVGASNNSSRNDGMSNS